MTTQTYSFRRLFVLLCLVWLGLNAIVLAGHKVLPWDAMDEFYPTVYFNTHSLRLGLAPWWNPYLYGGTPAIADPQGMLFSPLLTGWMLLRQSPGPVWFDWGVLLHLLMGGTAMLAVLRRYGANAVGALVGASVFMMGGVAASRLEHTPDAIAYAYSSVVLLALQWFVAAPTFRRALLFGLAAGVFATHLVQVTYLFVFVLATFAIAASATRWAAYTADERIHWLAGLMVASMVAAIVALPQLLFSSAFMATSNRVAMPLEAAHIASLDLRDFLTLLMPNADHAFTGPVALVESFLYIGVIPLMSLAMAARAWKHPQNRWLLAYLAGVGALAALYMMGTHTPLYPWLYTWLPGLTHFRRPDDATYVLNFVFAIATGLCASQINVESRRELTILLAVAATWLAVAAAQMHDRHARPFVAVVAATIALWLLRRKQGEWRTAVCLLLVLAVDYSCYNLNGRFNAMSNTVAHFTHSEAVQFLAHELHDNDDGLPYRIVTHNTDVTWDNGVALQGFSSTQGYNPLRLALYEQTYKPRESSNIPEQASPLNTAPAYTLDRLLSVRYVVVGRRRDLPAYVPPANLVHVFSDAEVDIWRDDSAYPRILNPTTLIVTQPAMDMDATAFAKPDFRATAWLTPRSASETAPLHQLVNSCTGEVAVRKASSTPIKTSLTLRASTAGMLVFGDIDAPGWRAYIDGKATPIYRANSMFRAVCIPAGEHQLTFSFSPIAMLADAYRLH